MATLGNTTTPTANATNPYVNQAYFVSATATENGTVDSISVYYRHTTPSAQVKGCIWTDDGSGNGTLIGTSNVISPSTDLYAWWTATFPATKPTISNGVDYFIGFISENQNQTLYKYDTGIYTYDTDGNSYSSPTDITSAIAYSQLYGVYITYTPIPGPSLKIEGIEPASVEGVDWADINDIS